MLRGDDTPALVLAERLERAVAKNADCLVLMRKLIGIIHSRQPGHLKGTWTDWVISAFANPK